MTYEWPTNECLAPLESQVRYDFASRATRLKRAGPLVLISHNLLESLTTSFNRAPFSPRGFLRGEKVPKADEGGVYAI